MHLLEKFGSEPFLYRFFLSTTGYPFLYSLFLDAILLSVHAGRYEITFLPPTVNGDIVSIQHFVATGVFERSSHSP